MDVPVAVELGVVVGVGALMDEVVGVGVAVRVVVGVPVAAAVLVGVLLGGTGLHDGNLNEPMRVCQFPLVPFA